MVTTGVYRGKRYWVEFQNFEAFKPAFQIFFLATVLWHYFSHYVFDDRIYRVSYIV